MKRLKISLLILVIPFLAFTLHKYYISLTKIDYIKEEKAVQVTMRFFIDDVESTLENRYQVEFELATKEENSKSDFYLEKYIVQKFQVSINNQPIDFKYLGKEYENDVVFFYLEKTDVEQITSIEIQNTMLFEDLPDQANYIKSNINNSKKVFILIKENDKEMLNF